MTGFEKVKMAFSKMTRFLKSKMDMIILLTVLIVLASVYFWLQIRYVDKTNENTRVTINCNNQNISHPIASEHLIFLKNLLLTLGIAFSCCLELACSSLDHIGIRLPQKIRKINVIRERIFVIPLVRWMACFLIGLFGSLILRNAALVQVLFPNRDYADYVSRNFLAICEPRQLNQLCKPESQDCVTVMCTTPIHMWMPAVRWLLPKMMTIFLYLMLTSMFRMLFKWDWEKMFLFGLVSASHCLCVHRWCWSPYCILL